MLSVASGYTGLSVWESEIQTGRGKIVGVPGGFRTPDTAVPIIATHYNLSECSAGESGWRNVAGENDLKRPPVNSNLTSLTSPPSLFYHPTSIIISQIICASCIHTSSPVLLQFLTTNCCRVKHFWVMFQVSNRGQLSDRYITNVTSFAFGIVTIHTISDRYEDN